MRIVNGLTSFAVAGLALVLGAKLSAEEESRLSLDATLAKWELASRQIQTFDTAFTSAQHRSFVGDDKSGEGRIYYESPRRAYLEVSKSNEALAWTSDGLFVINHRNKDCMFWSLNTIKTAKMGLSEMPVQTFWQRFWKEYVRTVTWPGTHSSLDELLPLLLNTDTRATRQRFDVSLELRDGAIFVKALPRQAGESYEEVDVMLNAETFALRAYRMVWPSGDRTLLVFSDVKINKPAADRDRLLNPLLLGYSKVNADEIVGGTP